MNYGSSTSSSKPWRWARLDLAFTVRYIYTSFPTWVNPLTKFNSSSRSTEFKDILPWNISEKIAKTTEFPDGVKTIVKQTLASENRNKSKRAQLWVRVPSRKVNNLNKFNREHNHNIVYQVYQLHQNRLASPYDGR